MVISEDEIWELLEGVFDPEVPVLSVVDLGIIRSVSIEKQSVYITITPTYIGCPAMQTIEKDIESRFADSKINNYKITTSISPAWTTDWMSNKGREKLKAYGIAPPQNEPDKSSLFAHPVIVSLLVDQKGIVQGRRIFTDNRIGDYERRNAFTLIRNFKARFGKWNLNCIDIGMKEGEQPVGNQFIHEQCIGRSIDGLTSIAIKATYLRKKGQRGINRTTQEVNQGYFESQTKYEEVLAPFETTILP